MVAQGLFAFVVKIVSYRGVILALARRQLAMRYVGTIAGPLWTVAQPLATVAVFWFVFSLGFRAHGPQGAPFLVYFLPGYIVWLLFSEVVTMSTSSVVSNAYLVKKTVFPVQVLPVVHIAAASVPHAVMIVATVLFVSFYEGHPPLAAIEVIYFYCATLALALGIGWLLAALNVFCRDVEQITTVLMNLWFWATPIAWPASILPAKLWPVLAMNPMFFIVEGYRTSLAGLPSSTIDLASTILFWSVAAVLLCVGAQVFRRLKPDFPELL